MARIAIVDKKKCSPENCGHFLCIRVCPVNRRGDECIVEWEDHKPSIDEKICIGCGICVKKCPFGAISIINLPEQLDKPPIHCYGKNGFHLFNLPMPIFGKVVGIIGRNGIGKTTAINILSGLLKPNLGKPRHKAKLSELVEYFKGTELHNYFEKLEAGEIRVAVKPQQVSLIPKHFSGTVRELLKKMDEKHQIEGIVKQLNLIEVLDRHLNQISGGELQKVAIAACALKKAQVYFFDEPTSYLDVKQRILVSKFIRGLADENTAVVVIEHDLILLDYMTDLVHITFGEPSAYGIVSGLKSTREGVNEYLSGMLRKENIRFRANPITFDDKPPAKSFKHEGLVEWEHIEKQLGGFKLEVEPGAVSKKTTVGILGENGIGKTTFVRIVAGELEPDKGKISKKVSVSYKPQYIDTDSKEKVKDFLKDAITKSRNEIVLPLELDKVLNEKLCELSGGELQKVMIAKCLADEEAELYLMDEPSAYLDVEQRLTVSKLIRRFTQTHGKTALIVDHDMLFVDYLSDELIVFEGKPAVEGLLKGPYPMEQGMNLFLSSLEISMRRDPDTKRPKINKQDSRLDREQKKLGRLYYA
ncbi:ribosome biogenesis/translation initiation ATPase RLI [Candidatus Woesearchaeota archaeon]|nr:ribosome biogenesis/translation initiation ATPase RLI [Candidatus Woesearchaeota archaeon]